jgi:hypothetical protein
MDYGSKQQGRQKALRPVKAEIHNNRDPSDIRGVAPATAWMPEMARELTKTMQAQQRGENYNTSNTRDM